MYSIKARNIYISLYFRVLKPYYKVCGQCVPLFWLGLPRVSCPRVLVRSKSSWTSRWVDISEAGLRGARTNTGRSIPRLVVHYVTQKLFRINNTRVSHIV